MTEAELEAEIANACSNLDIWRHHAPDSRRGEAGWVDDVILGRKGALFVENKSEAGRRSLAQIKVANLLVMGGLSYRLWRPSDWQDGTIMKALREIR